ncbi:hypothetical protein EES39_38770 [Streptomyces sp. ADI92-24]|uniref:hypothetical protein n=1 Tax=Streptomyces sp. ADI92-24 TaxID=1522756 RepID=UPI000F5550C9|nr:hypothetical protein [Streptomyces sp. ADI92-24]RPK32434.1 hypothetical protein EES39_38770 [Streptomyces sp. ADI92-24]
MLETIPDVEVDAEWPYYDRAPRERLSAGSRLAALRRGFYENALSAVAKDRQVRVTTYVLAGPGIDAGATHALLAEFADGRGWRLCRGCFTDRPRLGPVPAGARPEFYRACRAAGAGFVDGILTTSRQAMPASDDAYEGYLRWLHDRFTFIAYLPTPGGTSWTD